MKLLVLVIATDDSNVYVKLQELWYRQIIASKVSEIQVYFIKCDPNLSEPIKIIDKTVWVKYEEDMFHGITYKTIKAIEYFLQHDKYDYILRTNLSSFYVFERLYDFLDKSRRDNFYGGVPGNVDGIKYASGSGFIISRDIAEKIVEGQDKIWDPVLKWDDVCFGKYILEFFPDSYVYMHRFNVTKPNQEISLDESLIHYRIKHENVDRMTYDIKAREFLLNFYLKY